MGRIPSAPTTQGGGGNPQTPSGKPPGAHPNSTGHRFWQLRRRALGPIAVALKFDGLFYTSRVLYFPHTHCLSSRIGGWYTSFLRGFKDPQLPNISTFMNQPYPLRALRTRKWGV